MLTSLPNLLTLSRIVVIPVLVAMFFIEGDVARWIAMYLRSEARDGDGEPTPSPVDEHSRKVAAPVPRQFRSTQFPWGSSASCS